MHSLARARHLNERPHLNDNFEAIHNLILFSTPILATMDESYYEIEDRIQDALSFAKT